MSQKRISKYGIYLLPLERTQLVNDGDGMPSPLPPLSSALNFFWHRGVGSNWLAPYQLPCNQLSHTFRLFMNIGNHVWRMALIWKFLGSKMKRKNPICGPHLLSGSNFRISSLTPFKIYPSSVKIQITSLKRYPGRFSSCRLQQNHPNPTC